jgi:hypothetical protein
MFQTREEIHCFEPSGRFLASCGNKAYYCKAVKPPPPADTTVVDRKELLGPRYLTIVLVALTKARVELEFYESFA